MQKTFVGPHLRRLRQERGETQQQMARTLGISASYVNLLESNERSVSVTVLLRLFEAYGVDWKDIADDQRSSELADLRAALQDPLFAESRPDLAQLRAAITHSPGLTTSFLRLHRAYQAAADQLLSLAGSEASDLATSPESMLHNEFRRNRNHYPELEEAATQFLSGWRAEPDETYVALKRRLADDLGLSVRLVRVEELPGALRTFDEARREILLSEALDYANRTFQLAHMYGLLRHSDILDGIVMRSRITDPRGMSRLRVELSNYFAAAVLMPYDAFLSMARATKYDMDHIATRFGVTFEQVCQRATTLQRDGAQGVPLFFLRIDKGGNVSKRFNATGFHLAEYGGACPRLDVHTSFRTPGRILAQFVETPDRSQFFVFSRTVDRPTWARHAQDNRLAIAMGCAVEHAREIGYAEAFSVEGARMTEVGINCRVCPRANCDQRAHQAVITVTPVDEHQRRQTRFGD